MSGLPIVSHPQAHFWRTVKAVLWSFVGLRKKADLEQDTEKLNPFFTIGVAIAVVMLFVLGLMALVNWVVAQPTGL